MSHFNLRSLIFSQLLDIYYHFIKFLLPSIYVSIYMCPNLSIFFLFFKISHYLYVGLYFFLLLSYISLKLYFCIIYLFILFFCLLGDLFTLIILLTHFPSTVSYFFVFLITIICKTYILVGYLNNFLLLFRFLNILSCHFENIDYNKYIYQCVPMIFVHAFCVIHIVFFLLLCLNSLACEFIDWDKNCSAW